MREIARELIAERVAGACREANLVLPLDVRRALEHAAQTDSNARAREILADILRNADLSPETGLPLCQDCGLVVVFAEVGQDARITGGTLADAIDDGIRGGYEAGYLRKSMLANPLDRASNTGDNTPAVVHVTLVQGDGLKLVVAPKGGGCENMSAVWMLTPSQGRQGIIDAVVARIQEAGGRPCPPLILGVGVGGSFEHAAVIAKKAAIVRTVGEPHADPELAQLEADLLAAVNATGVGPMGLRGDTTALAVHVESSPCHIASLPVAMNVQCHSARHKTVEL
ncbi:MAG TPA: fumarate hydratase [Armatimonadota bacterium]|nr:fumarate hydratase [Armatimonadota bacterium]